MNERVKLEAELVLRDIIVSYNEDGLRLDQMLSKRYQDYTRSVWQKRIARKEVLVNGHLARCSRKLNLNDKVTFQYPRYAEREVNKNYSVLYEDDFLLAINKPANLPVHSSAQYEKNNLLDILQEQMNKKYFLVHRLDRETSGVLLLAKDKKTAAYFSRQFFKKNIKKEYRAVLRGCLEKPIGAEGFIKPADHYKHFRMQKFFLEDTKNKGEKEYKLARTEIFPLKKINCQHEKKQTNQKNQFTLAQIFLHSGRTHQIRATALALGFPLAGDKLYGGDPSLMQKFVRNELTKQEKDFLMLDRSALHCYCLTFIHPTNKKTMSVTAETPQEFSALFSD